MKKWCKRQSDANDDKHEHADNEAHDNNDENDGNAENAENDEMMNIPKNDDK